MTDKETEPDIQGNGPDEFPTEDELPDEPLTADDISPFSVDTSEFDDINELAEAEWQETTTADERIRAVIKRTQNGKSAAEIADQASVSETKARNTLNALVEEGIVQAQQTESGKHYQRHSDWYLLQKINQLAQSDTLVDQIQRTKKELTSYREKYGTDSPEEVLVSDTELSESDLTDISHWRTAKQQFSYLRAAYRFREAREQAAATQLSAPQNQVPVHDFTADQSTDPSRVE